MIIGELVEFVQIPNESRDKENILKKDYKEIGVAVAKSQKGEPYWVQVFGTQR